MIRLDLSTAVAIYTFITVIGALLLWILFSQEDEIKQYNSEKKFIWQCSICTHTYVDSVNTTISKCPQCGSFNKRRQGDDNEDRHSGRGDMALS